MSVKQILPALVALAIAMLTGCKQPVGLPGNRVHIAATCTTYCTVGSGSILSGRVEQRVDGGTPYTYTIYDGDIRREYGETGGYPDPRTYGFCVFDVPYFESLGGTPACTLFYYQTYRDGSLDLTFKWLPEVASWQPSAFVLFSARKPRAASLKPQAACYGSPRSAGRRGRLRRDGAEGFGLEAGCVFCARGTKGFKSGA